MNPQAFDRIFGQPLYMHEPAALTLALAVLQSEIPEPKEAMPARPKVDYYGDAIPQMEIVDRTALIPVSGGIIKGATGFDKYAFGVTSHDDISADLDAAFAQRDKLDRVCLLMNSPGGSAMGCPELGGKVAQMRDSGLPVLSWNESLCCSAAEYISAGAIYRGASPSSMNGSIGARMDVVDISRMLEKFGVHVEVFASGKYKAAGHPAKPLTDDQKDYFATAIKKLGAEFQTHMATQRPAMKLAHMQGQIFTGAEALDIGLVDTLANSRAEFLQSI